MNEPVKPMEAPQATPPILAVNNIEVIYDHVILVLKGVSLTVPKGGFVALLGANGAGKTTTLKAISNLLGAERGDVTKGSIAFDGAAVQAMSPNALVRRGCIQVMEGRHCFGHLTVEENLLTGAYTRRDGGRAVSRDLELVYTYFPRLKERRKSQAGYTSGGEQQMTAIGRALMSRPKMMLLDEPSMGLAPQLVEEIFGIVSRLQQRAGFERARCRAEHQYRFAPRPLRLHPRKRPRCARRRCGLAQVQRGREGVLSRRIRRRAQILPRGEALPPEETLACLNAAPPSMH